jgi:hypothetical protein
MEKLNTLQVISQEWLAQQFGKIEKQIRALEAKEKEEFELLTREEAADFLKINLSTLHAWQKKGIVRAYYIENRVYYLREELIALPKAIVIK